ncbi:hypothetical protein GQX73_g1369 [Xylaria multiplex]|uniref:3-dehydrosphinganine reductase n=1 Tax=Xylaria multiplex TaxID=323545 RepID=A0A7C8IVT5_9PEZI|nr:hypothetical protein GQX73_g1369 [Xylaria multiplex]
MAPANSFQVYRKTVIITGGSRGMGLAVAHKLAAKGANVVIVARDKDKLREGIAYVKKGALDPEIQRFHSISADLALASEAVRVVDEVLLWNSNVAPDITLQVWCCAGSSYPTLFVDTPVSEFSTQMNNNYFTSLYMAHAILKCWLKGSRKGQFAAPTTVPYKSGIEPTSQPTSRHIIFTASFLAFYSFAGYAAYSPSKAALRSLSDSLSQEMNLYAAAYPKEPRVRLHTIFPSGILTDSYEAENRVKCDLTKLLEEGDKVQTADIVASKSIKALESGQELITTDFQTRLVKGSMLGGSIRGGVFRGLGDYIIAILLTIVMIFVRADHDKKVRNWGSQFGASGMRGSNGVAQA